MNPENSFYSEEAYRYFREAYEKQMKGEIEAAISLYKQSLEVLPTAEAYTFLGWAYSFTGHYDQAIAECKKAIDLDPDYGNPYNDIGSYLIEKGQPDDAIAWLEKALEARRYDAYCYPYYNLGRIWENKGRWDKAIEYYQHALRENAGYELAGNAYRKLQGLLN